MKKKPARYTTKGKRQQPMLLLFPRPFIVVGIGAIAFVATMLFQTHYSLLTCANSKSCTSDLSETIEQNAIGTFEGHRIQAPSINPQPDLTPRSVLGDSTASGEKHIYVDLSTQTLYAYQGTSLLLKTFIASGRWNKTPVGNFHIWSKLRSTRMSGGEGADAYDLPNVPYVMYFYHDFGLHGAYWHDNFGHTMSHGCVNMRAVDAKVVFDWADGPANGQQGTAVSICDQITDNQECIQHNPIQ